MTLGLILFSIGFIGTLSVTIGFLISVMSGNLKSMKFLAKNGVALFCGDMEKDYNLLKYVNDDGIGWVKIPNNCYLPIMEYANGYYKNHNFLKKESDYGEVHLSSGINSTDLSKIALEKRNGNYLLKDLTILDGASLGNASNVRTANFSNLIALKGNTQEIEIIDNGLERKFKVLGVIEQCVGDMKSLKYSSRSDLIDSLLKNAVYNARYTYKDSHILILRTKFDILNILVLLIEV